MIKVPATYPSISDADIAMLQKVIDSGWFTEGKFCSQFTRKFSEFVELPYVTLVNSGSSANFVALRALLDRSSKSRNLVNLVITTATAFTTTVAPIYQHGAIPAYVDTEPGSLSPNIGQVAYMVDKYKDSIVGGIFTHTLGFPYYEPLIKEILGEDRWLISDCCDALGADIGGIPVGAWSDISTYSFFPAHHIMGIQAGAIVTGDKLIHRNVEQYVRWGRDCYCLPGQSNVCGKRFEQDVETLPVGWDHKYLFTKLGYNLQSNEFSGALLVSQLERLSEFTRKRKENYIYLDSNLRELEDHISFVEFNRFEFSPFGFPMLIKDRDKVREFVVYLEKRGVSTRRMFGGNLTRHPAFANLVYISSGDLSGSDKLLETCVWVGCHPSLTKKQLDHVVTTIKGFFDGK